MAEILGISKPYAYKIIKQLNEELEAKGFIAIPSRVSKKYFEEKFYGVETA
jgi:GTP cyclohydrolase I